MSRWVLPGAQRRPKGAAETIVSGDHQRARQSVGRIDGAEIDVDWRLYFSVRGVKSCRVSPRVILRPFTRIPAIAEG